MPRHEHASRLARSVRLGMAMWGLSLACTGHARNTAPYSESFEGYAHGTLITNVTGWSAAISNAGVVSTNPVPVGALTTFTNAGYAFPLPAATHTNVLEMSEALTNSVASTTGGVVIVDLLTLPVQREFPPAGSTNHQFACYFDTNNQLVVWHCDSSVPTNTWLALTNSPTTEIRTGAWSRLTVWQDYSNKLFQVAVNGHAPITDAKGWTSGGGSQTGTWFRMVGTNNAYMSRFGHHGELTAWLDDLVVTNRSVSWSGMSFAESAANNGSVATTQTLTLYGDTFVNTTYATGTHFTASGVPAGLSLALGYLNPTQLVVSLTGHAAPHTAAASTNAMSLSLLGPAFTLGRAADVGGFARSGMSVTFADPPVLSYAGAPYVEGPANNGSIGNAVTITLSGGETFTNVSTLVAGSHYTTYGIPPNLGLLLTVNSTTQLTASLTNTASSHGANNSTNFGLAFLDGAFANVAASNILGSATNFDIRFAGSAELIYSTNVFREAAANNGTVLGGTIDILGELFAGAVGEDFVAAGKVLTNHVPAGLSVALTLNAASNRLTVAFGGSAASHANTNDVTDLTFTFQNEAFLNSAASSVSNYNRGDLRIDFLDQPVMNYSGTNFAEDVANNGTMGNSLTITLDGTTFSGANGVAFGADKVTADYVPAGLTAVVTKVDSNTLSFQLTGTATVHRAISNTSSLSLQFHDPAFNTVLATNITGAGRDNLSVTFNDAAALAYSTNRFAEAAANDGTVLGGTIPLTGDQFTGADGETFGPAKVVFTNVPAGLTGVVTRTGATLATLSFAGKAVSHMASNSVANLGLTFLSAAFSGGNAGNVAGAQRTDLAIDFRDAPVLSYTPSGFAEATTNDGSIGNTVLFTLTGETFTNIAFLTAGEHYTTSGVPAGLGFELQVLNPTQVTARLTGNASPHDSGANGAIALSFLNAAFANVATDQIAGAAANLPVTFDNPPLLTYSGDTFLESNHGAIGNSLTITLSSDTGESFAGVDNDDFVALNRVAVSALPNHLTAVVARVSATVLNVTLTGAAVNNTSANNVTNMTLTFQDGAFSRTQASQVRNYAKGDLRIEFLDAATYVNRLPYRESFESYTNGVALGEEQGWSPAGAGVVTAETAIVSALTNGFTRFPIPTNHVQVLRLDDEVSSEILSEAGGLLYADMMLYVMPRDQEPLSSTNYQFAMYVNTNQNLVLWHRDTSGTPTNTWVTLTGAPTVTTGAWHRVTVVQDQGHFRYQLYIDGSRNPVTDTAGYASPAGLDHPGSWFNMVNQNGYVSRIGVKGHGGDVPGYMDDLVVDTRGPGFVYTPGTVFKFR